MQLVNVELFTPEEVAANVVRAIDLADTHSDRDCREWDVIFRAAYDGLASRQAFPVQESPINLSAILTNGRG